MSLATRLLKANPSIQVSTLLSGSLVVPSRKFANAAYPHGAGENDLAFRRLDFGTETLSTLSANIVTSAAQFGEHAGMSDDGTAGYSGGGREDGVVTAKYNKLNYLSETSSSLSANLTRARGGALGAFTNLKTAGFCFGGFGNPEFMIDTDKLLFSTETRIHLPYELTREADRPVGLDNGNTAGYSCGGFGPSVAHATIDKFTFSTGDLKSTISAVLPAVNQGMAGMSNGTTAGYLAGGWGTGGLGTNSIIKLLYSNETTSTLGATLAVATFQFSGSSNNGFAGYTFGGYSFPANASIDVISKLLYSSETRTALAAVLPATRRNVASFGNNG